MPKTKIFLMEYDRNLGRLISMRSFDEGDRQIARRARIELELELNKKKVDHEVVLLEAANEETLRRTYRRYFESLEEILNPSPTLKRS